MRWFWKGCEGAGAFAAAMKLMLLTGQRRSEIGGMRWDELRDDEWHLPKERTKNKLPHIVPLPPTAAGLIAGQEPRRGQHVFTTDGTAPISGWSKAKRKLEGQMLEAAREERKADVAIPQWGLHDLRRTMVTGAAELGIRPDVIEQVVNHISGHRSGVAGIYNRSVMLPERKAALERWEAHVLGIVEARPANVSPIRRKG
jgi:integrase